MARMRYVVTGGTGFIGRRVVSQILGRSDDAEVWVLVRRGSLARFERLATQWGDRAKALVGDLTAENLGLAEEAVAELGAVDHIVHCAAIYDALARSGTPVLENRSYSRLSADMTPATLKLL